MKEHSDSKTSTLKMISSRCLSVWQITFPWFFGKVFQQIVGISMGTNYAPLLADIFLYSYEAEFIQFLLSTGRKELVSHRGSISHTGTSMMFFHKHPRVWELPGPDVSHLTWNQRLDREQHFCFLAWFTSVDREGRSTSHFHLRQT